MTTDEREMWEIDWHLRVQNALHYAKYFTLSDKLKEFYALVYHTEDIARWAKERIERNARAANEMLEAHGGALGFAALSAVADSEEQLARMGFAGLASGAGTAKESADGG